MNTQHVRMAESDEAYEQVRADSRRCLPGLGSGDVYPLSVASKLKSVKKRHPLEDVCILKGVFLKTKYL